MTSTDVSVVITTRDRPELAQRALRSALAQTRRVADIVVVDDGSAHPFRPGSPDARIRIIRHASPLGVCAARNAGLRASVGAWVTFLDDDDELLPHMVETSLRVGRESQRPPPIAVLTGMEVVDRTGSIVEVRSPPASSLRAHFFLEGGDGDIRATNTLFAPRDVLTAIGGWDESIRAGEHDDLLLRLNAVASIEASPLVTYRMLSHGGPRLHDDLLAYAEGMEHTVRKHRSVFDRHPERFARYLGVMGATYLRAGRWGPAVRATTEALLRDPTRAKHFAWWLASLAGPHGLTVYRWAKRRFDAAVA